VGEIGKPFFGGAGVKLVTVKEIQAVEREADAKGHSYSQMMEYAGKGVAEVVQEEYGELPVRTILGLVGSGNNGGDTLVALAHLAENYQWSATAYLVRPRIVGDPLLERLTRVGGSVLGVEQDHDYHGLMESLANHAVWLDGILGTGVILPLKPEIARVLELANQAAAHAPDSPPLVVAVDCPSGVNCDNGEAPEECLPADLTITMAAVKQGLLRLPAYGLLGKLRLVGIGIGESDLVLDSWESIHRNVADAEMVRSILPQRPLEAHKGTFGTALVVAGSLNYTGAALLAGEAAYRIGAGLVTLAIPEPLHPALAGRLPEATWLLLPEDGGFIAAEAAELIPEALQRTTAWLVGPGFGVEETTRRFISSLVSKDLKNIKGGMGFMSGIKAENGGQKIALPPMVMDADGLKLLAKTPHWHTLIPSHTVLTPHPGEMAVLTGLTKDEIQADRLGIAEEYSRKWGHVVVLKGAFTVIAAPEGETTMIPVATPALARAGTGDVLAGLIVGLLVQGVSPYQAAIAAAWIHAQAGLLAAELLGTTISVLASDVLAAVPEIIASL
jgi:NAD(P)H-hydrate epimerase